MNIKKIRDNLFEATITVDNIYNSCLGATPQEAMESLKNALMENEQKKKEDKK